MHWTTEQDPTQSAPLSDWCVNYKVGPQPGCSFECLTWCTHLRVGPQPGGPHYVPDPLNNREGPQAREPSKCLNRWRYRERLIKEAFWSPATRGLKKDSGRAMTPAAEAVRVLHTWRHECLRKLSSCSCSTLTGAELPQAKKVLHLCTPRHFGSVWLFVTLWTVACQASLSGMGGISREEYRSLLTNIGCHTLLEHYISTAIAANSPENLVLPETLWLKQLHHLHTWPSQGQPQEQTPVDNPHAKVEIKPQLKPRGSVAKEEDTKPSHQLYKMQIKSTRSTRHTMSLEYIKGHRELPQKKMH